ncbi:MAG: hypothetical protein JNM52_10455 [Betaproteobacteria bacterium]|nr:hypothetical protein [Betaproteobacteria bacterium]
MHPLLLIALPDSATLQADSLVAWQVIGQSENPCSTGTLKTAPRAERVVVTIPTSRMIFIETPLPPVTGPERDKMVRYAIEDKLTIDPATIHAIVLGKARTAPNAPSAHVVVAIDRHWLRQILATLQSVGISPEMVVPETEMVEVAADQWVVAIGAEQGFAKRADGFAYSVDTATLEPPPFALELALQEAAKRQLAPQSLALMPWGEADASLLSKGLLQRWQTVMHCAVQLAPTPPSLMNRLGAMKAANLLVGEFAVTSPLTQRLNLFKPAIATAALIALAQISFVLIDGWRLRSTQRALDQEMAATFRNAFPQAQAIVDPALQMTRNLQALRRERGLVDRNDGRALLARLAAITGPSPGVKVQDVEIQGGEIQGAATQNHKATLSADLVDPALEPVIRQRALQDGGATLVMEPAKGNAPAKLYLTIKAELWVPL